MNILSYKIKKTVVYYILISGIMVSACKPNNSQKVQLQTDTGAWDSTQVVNPDSSETVVYDSATQINYLFPSPDEILGEILSTKSDFDLNIINPYKNAGKYLQSNQQALNLGVYLSDLAYINLNGDKTSAVNYVKTVRDLAQKINIYKIFNEVLYDRIQNNITNKDSLNAILKGMYNDILEVLEESKRNNIYSLVASGALIEALYISTMNVKDFEEYKPVATKIFEQKYVIDNFYDFVSQYKKDPNVNEVLSLLESLKTILASESSKESEKLIKKEKKDNFTIEGGEDLIVTEKNFAEFKARVLEIRQKVVSTK